MPGDPYQDLRRRVQRRMEARLALAHDEVSVERSLRQIEAALGLPRGHTDDRAALMEALQDTFHEALVNERVRLSDYESERLFGLIVGDMVGLGPVDPLLAEPGVGAVYVLDTQAVYVERGGRLVPTESAFDSREQLDKIVRRVFNPMGYWIGEGTGPLTGHLSGGPRVDAVATPDLSPDGVHLVVRQRPAAPPTLDGLVEGGMLPDEVAALLRASLLARRGVLIAGKVRSGKMALLEALADSLPDDLRLVTVERAAEMAVARQNLVRLEARPQQSAAYGTSALLRHAVALQPDWVWLSEVTADTARAYVEMLARLDTCAAMTLHAPDRQTAAGAALDRLTALALLEEPDLPEAVIEAQVAAGLGLVVMTGQGAGGLPLVREVARVRRDGSGWQLENLYHVRDGATESLLAATRDVIAEASRYAGYRTAPGQPARLTAPLVNPDGSLADTSLDELHLVSGKQAIGLREVEGVPVSGMLADPADEIRRLAHDVDPETLFWADERADGSRVALVRPPVSVGGTALTVERFAVPLGGLKRLADLGMLDAASGGLLVRAARAGRSILVCGPAGSGKRAFMQGLVRVLQDADEWQVTEGVDAALLPVLIERAGQGKTLAGVDCADGVDPLAALGAWRAASSGEEQAATARALAGAFTLLVRMGRVGGRQRMIVSIEEIISDLEGYRLEPLFAARSDDAHRLTLAQVSQPTF